MATGSPESLRPRVRFTPQVEADHEASIRYFKWGYSASLGVITKIHGDEVMVSGPVANCLVNAAPNLRGFAYIDRASPSAIALGREENEWGHNVNRWFFEPPSDPEVTCLMEIFRHEAPFETIVAFHEDEGDFPVDHPVRDETTPFSIYHYGAIDPWLKLNELRVRVSKLGVSLRNGIDVSPEDDPALGYDFIDGYNYTKYKDDDGTVDIWAVNRNLTRIMYTVEIPMWLPKLTKTSLCQAVFDCVILTNPLLAFRIHSYLK